MATRIDSNAAQSTLYPVETNEAANDAEVTQGARAGGAKAATLAKQEEAGSLDSIEQSKEQAGKDEEAPAHERSQGPSVSAHSLQVTGGRSGHQALTEKKAGDEKGAAKEEDRIKEGETSHYGNTGNALRDRNWVSHSRAITHCEGSKTVERHGLRPKVTERHSSPRSSEKGQTSHRNPGGPKTDASIKYWEKEVHGDVAAGRPVKGDNGSISLLELQGHAGLKFESDEGALRAQGSAGAAAYLVNAEAHGEHKGAVNLKGSAYLNVGARADGNVALELDLKKGVIAVKGGVDAFAGVTAGVNGEASAGGVKAGGEARVEAGIGFEANGTAEIKDGKLELEGDLGACVGFGADVKFNVEIDPREMIDTAQKANAYLGQKEEEAKAFVEKKGEEAADAALETAANGIAKAAGGVISFFETASEVAKAVKTGAEVLERAAQR